MKIHFSYSGVENRSQDVLTVTRLRSVSLQFSFAKIRTVQIRV